ncbi:MAG: hypothetical protein K1X57_13095 [Gemmataceae bacterium]|nr:hypothetical protein [Gemmataceae bacterium]
MPRKPFLIRVDEQVLSAVQKWADDDLRSLNAQIEWLLRKALTDRGRLKTPPPEVSAETGERAGPA